MQCNLSLEALGVGYFLSFELTSNWISSPTPQSSIFAKGFQDVGLEVDAENGQTARRTRLDTWPRGVTGSTLDSESSDRGLNPREAFRQCACKMSWQSSLRKVESGLKNILAKLVFASGSLKASLRKGQ